MAPPVEFITAAQAFGACIKSGSTALPAAVTPKAGSSQVLAGCSAQRTALDTQFEAWVSSPSFPEAGRVTARERYAAEMSKAVGQIADGIRKGRAAPAPGTLPAPAPTPTPTPQN